MTFKKKNITKKSKKNGSNLILNIFGSIAIIGIFFLGYFIVENINFINIDFFKQIKINNSNTQGENTPGNDDVFVDSISGKKDENKINILLAGRGGGSHEAPNLTDTIILASINTKTNIISMLSIPRDLYVEYDNLKSGKINQIYALESNKSGSKETGMYYLSKKISEITGEKIDYYVNIDFNGFEKIIDIIGGIKLIIEEDFTDNNYPDSNWGYKTITFKKGTWIFDGESALKYARSRHSTSDFSRSLRQQQIIEGIKNKLTATYLLTSPLKVKELYDTFKEYVLTNIDGKDIISLALKLKTSDYKILSSNINDSCFYGTQNCEKGGFLYTPNREFFGGASVLLANGTSKGKLNNYKKLHKYTNLVFNKTGLFEENYKINIFNSLKINFLASLVADNIKKYGFNIPNQNSIGNTKKVYEKSIIYYNSIGKDSQTLEILKEFYPDIDIKETIGAKYSKEMDTKIEIIIGNDYKEIFNIK